jgi:hypothetical protein
MENTIRKFASHEEAKAEEYRYWQSRPAHERIAAVSELTTLAYALKGIDADVQRLQGPLVRLSRTQR